MTPRYCWRSTATRFPSGQERQLSIWPQWRRYRDDEPRDSWSEQLHNHNYSDEEEAAVAVSLENLHKKARGPLERSLTQGEEVHDWVSGSSHQAMALTDRRVIVIKPGFMAGSAFGANASSFPLQDITSLEVRKRWGTSFLVVRTAGSSTADPTLLDKSADGYKLPNVIPIANAGLAQRFANNVRSE